MALLKGFLSSFSHIVKSQWVLLAGEHYVQPCSCTRFHYEREEEDRWTFFWNPPSTRPNSVCFSLIQSTHSEETHLTAASVLGHPFYSNTRVSFCETSLKSSPCERAHPFRGLSQRLVLLIHYRDHHFYLLHIPAWAPAPSNPNTSQCAHTYTHTQHKTTPPLSSGNNDEAWWQRQAAEKEKSTALISHLWHKRLLRLILAVWRTARFPGMSWHPAATGSMLHFHCLEKRTPAANIVCAPETWAEKKVNIPWTKRREGKALLFVFVKTQKQKSLQKHSNWLIDKMHIFGFLIMF